MNNQENCEVPWFRSSALQSYRGNCGTRSFGTFEKQDPAGREIKQRSAWDGREEGKGGMKMNESLDDKVFDCLLSLESQLDANIT